MSKIESAAEPLRKAYELAFFIHPTKTTALRIASAAMAKLEVAATAQAKRLYYRPSGRRSGRTTKSAEFRTKVSLEELALLQRLVFIESEPHERETEKAPGVSSLSRHDLLVRFLKHLAQITIRRSSFYVTIGIARILHNYSTAETMRIHDSLLRDPDRMKDADYFRARKAILVQEVRNRFSDFLTDCRTSRGEERFESRPPSQEYAKLVEQCLERFAPWNTPCLSRADLFDTEPGQKNDENRIEVRRMHAILHPGCFRQLAPALGLDPPDRRLEIPVFSLAVHGDDDGGPSPVRRHPPDLTAEDLAAVRRQLEEETARRRKTTAGLLRILVDGTERTRLDPGTTSRAQFNVESGAEVIEVWTSESEGDILLAVHLLRDEPATVRTAVVLENRQTISFSISLDTTGSAVEIAYRDATPAWAISITLRQILFGERGFPILRPILRFAVFTLALVGIGFFVKSRTRQTEAPLSASSEIVMPPVPIQASPSPVVQAFVREPDITALPVPPSQEENRHAPTKGQEDRIAREWLRESPGPARSEGDTETEGTRALRVAPADISLRDVKTVFVEVPANQPDPQRLRELIIRELRMTHRLRIAETSDQADAVLRTSWFPSRGVTARLVNPSGRVIWPAGRGQETLAYQGSSDVSARALIADLQKAIALSEPKK